ncbi:cytochrome c biogenesis protein ResB [Domibacillus mangrovi]|uniref:Cytochrome C biogenesis protein n=1 Tax=Domibacillus mangrovi TaxID=1714354 RepID=A0A1Q5P768_9BACI|nr:cytochrome c biogenesis protein ResB [Domibacillus mangrovi]OKL38018.1 cytochrome C biogenesis protein [Domibacillus mangrovi]
MGKVKCECGHVNPHGTILCESCGRSLTDEAKKENLVDMRYEGSARRSQTYNKTIIDKVWNFFSSVKVGIWIIVLILVAASFGTILPQEFYIPSNVGPEVYYEDVYGWFGKIYYMIGFHDLYNSIWFSALIAALGVSLVICSLDRVIPLYRALKTQRVDRHESFMKKQRLFAEQPGSLQEADMEKVRAELKKKHYKIREKNGSLLAEKNRFSRWGPYVNHIGLILFLFGAMLRSVQGMYVDELLWIREGETMQIPGTDGEYYVKNDQFTLENYEEGEDSEVFNEAINRVGTVAKNYQTDAILYRDENNGLPGAKPELSEVKHDDIRVNEPMKFDNFAVYQTSFRQDEMKAMHFALTNKETGREFGEVVVDLFDQQAMYDLGNGYKVELLGYYPDFDGFTEEGEPISKSPLPNKPAFLFNMISPEKPDGEVSFVEIQNTMEPLGETTYKMAFKNLETRDVSALTIRKDLTLPILSIGGIIFMIGVIQGAYWNHRRIWIREKDGSIYMAGHTNKNWHGLKREIHTILEGTALPEPEDRQTD